MLPEKANTTDRHSVLSKHAVCKMVSTHRIINHKYNFKSVSYEGDQNWPYYGFMIWEEVLR
jgi:hypothetical protein